MGESLIKKTPGVMGGEACIRDTRIAVWQIAELCEAGVELMDVLSPEYFPFLTFDDLLAVNQYWYENQKEIADAIQANNAD